MVRAILSGQKTQTRRVIRNCPTPWKSHDLECGAAESDWWPAPLQDGGWAFCSGHHADVPIGRCPYGSPGDRLWVREAWADDGRRFRYRAVPELPLWPGPWCPSIHMPRRASRITLEVTEVRVERLQDISPADATAEGVVELSGAQRPDHAYDVSSFFEPAWDAINGKRAGCSWADNPWVWAVTFKRVRT